MAKPGTAYAVVGERVLAHSLNGYGRVAGIRDYAFGGCGRKADYEIGIRKFCQNTVIRVIHLARNAWDTDQSDTRRLR